MYVQEFASRSRVAPHVVRYYVRIGLLHPRRSANRYARFAESDLTRLSFVRHAQQLGFTLAEIRGLLALHDSGQSPCSDVRIIARRRKEETTAELRRLTFLEKRIGRALRRWRRIPDGEPNHPEICPLIAAAGD